MDKGTLEDLRSVIALNELPEDHLKWIYERCEYYEYTDGHLIWKTGDPANDMIFLVEGQVLFYLDMNGKLVYFFTFENNEQTGGAGGLLPYSRMKTSPGNSYAQGKVRAFYFNKKHFPELERLNPDLIQRLIGYMTERARHFATQKLQHEKVNALGQLAAGIAHELNNPAAAINRISAELNRRMLLNYDLTQMLLTKGISPETIQTIRAHVDTKAVKSKKKLFMLERIEKEDEIFDWLEKHGVKSDREIAETLTVSEYTLDELENIYKTTGGSSFQDILMWMENALSSQALIKDMDEASCRISNLVGAIKSHVHMDRTNDKQTTDIHRDLENSLTLLGYKLRDKHISVKKNFCSDMPEVPAYVSELNQVWTNLIDNAIFAMKKDGELSVETHCYKNDVKVHIIDNGGGIPQDIASRIFDPFFTTKKVGEGSGIGLDLVMRIVKRHDGDVKFNSVPGRTEFIICLPLNSEPKKNTVYSA
jgi:signal transduction histidine kinase